MDIGSQITEKGNVCLEDLNIIKLLIILTQLLGELLTPCTLLVSVYGSGI